MNLEDERLVNLSLGELEALANSGLLPKNQTQLNELLAKNTNDQLSSEEQVILDELLQQVDHLNLLKARAKYTLSCLQGV